MRMASSQMAHLWLSKGESCFKLHCAIWVQNHQLFPGGNSWQFIFKIREDKSESCDRASLSNKILSRSGLSPFVQHLSDYCFVVLTLNHNIV